jgi:hypothetical protein
MAPIFSNLDAILKNNPCAAVGPEPPQCKKTETKCYSLANQLNQQICSTVNAGAPSGASKSAISLTGKANSTPSITQVRKLHEQFRLHADCTPPKYYKCSKCSKYVSTCFEVRSICVICLIQKAEAEAARFVHRKKFDLVPRCA